MLENVPHIVQLNEFKDTFSVKPENNHYLMFRNEDKPGAVLEVCVYRLFPFFAVIVLFRDSYWCRC